MLPRYTRRKALVLSGQAVLLASGVAAGVGRIYPVHAVSEVTIGAANVLCKAPAHLALKLGYFADEGLQASVVDRGGTSQQALAQGSIDAYVENPVVIIPPSLVSGLSLGDLVMTSVLQRGCGSLVASPDGMVQSVVDLQGQTVAGSEFLFGTPLAAAGLDPGADITWRPALATPADVLQALQAGDVAAAQLMHGRGTYLQASGLARVLVMNNTPPAENDSCCNCLMSASAVQSDRPKAVAINRALMRAAAWAQTHRSETAALMEEPLAGENVSRDTLQTALATLEFAPRGESARTMLMDQFSRYLLYGLPVQPPTDAATIVDRIFTPLLDEGELQNA